MPKRLPLSPAYRALKTRIRQLNQFLLPRRTPLAGPSLRTQTRALGFRLLAHAEIEIFIEERAWEVVVSNINTWKLDGKPRSVLMALLAFCGEDWETIVDEASGAAIKKMEMTLETKLHRAAMKYFSILEGNHGVREKNVLRMLVPIGISKDQINNTWLTTIDSFAGSRGITAHTSGSGKVVNPSDEVKIVNDIVTGLDELDRKLSALL